MTSCGNVCLLEDNCDGHSDRHLNDRTGGLGKGAGAQSVQNSGEHVLVMGLMLLYKKYIEILTSVPLNMIVFGSRVMEDVVSQLDMMP